MSQKRVFNTNAEHIYVNDVPEYNLDLVNARSIDPTYSFTRNSAATYIGPDGYIKTAGVNQPRFEYDPVTGEYKGLLVEESRTNYFIASNDLTNTTYWLQDGTIISLDGTNNRGNYYKIRGTNAAYRGLASNFTVWGVYPGASQIVTLSMDAKVPDDESGDRLLLFTVVATVGNTGGFSDTFFATVSNTSTSGIDLGNGWRRYSAIYTWMSSWNGQAFVKINPFFSGSQSVLIANLQLERGSFRTSYIPTSGSTVTRQPDQLVLNRSLNTQGTFYVESNPRTGIPLVADNGSSSLSISQRTNQYTRSVLYYNTNRTLRMSSDNSAPSDYIYTNPQDLNRVSLGFNRFNNSSYINGYLKKFSYYSSPLSEDNLRALTNNKTSTVRLSENIVTNGLVLNLDAGNPSSYPGSGTTWTDLSGNGNNGTLRNGPTYSSSNGGSIVFDGVNDFVDLGNILNIGTGQFSIECIARVSSLSTAIYSKVASKGIYNVDGWRLQMGKTPSNVYNLIFEYDPTSSISILAGIQTNTWYHFLVCRDGNNLISTYANGVLKTTVTATSNLTNANYNYIIGNNGSTDEPFNGNVACYRHYNRALTASEVQQNFNALRGRFGI
jgi:hypothetical protein